MFNSTKRKVNALLIVIVFMHVWSFNIYAQALKAGERMPDYEFRDVFNSNGQTLRFSGIKKKLIIFDFWGPSCASCLESFPKLDSLQKKYGNDIQIILVNEQSLDSTRNLFATRKFLHKPDLPFITNDTLLNHLFPNKGNPYLVWLDGKGNVKGMTETITSGDIDAYLRNKVIDSSAAYGVPKYLPDLFDPQYVNAVGYYSLISKAIDKVNLTGAGIGENGVAMINTTVLKLFIKAYDPEGKYQFSKPGRLVLDILDSSKYFRPKDDNFLKEWRSKNIFNYSLMLPEEKASEKYKIMKEDLDRYFDLKAQVKQKRMRSMVLVRKGRTDKLKSKGKDSTMTFLRNDIKYGIDRSERSLYNKPFTMFSGILAAWIEHEFSIPFVDKTNYTGNIDIKLSGDAVDFLDLQNLKKELNAYGLDLVEKKVLMDVLVLSDK